MLIFSSFLSDSHHHVQTGEWKWTGGEYVGAEGDKGIQTGQDARFYSLTAPLTSEFRNEGKDLVISYTVKHEQNLDCGGAYIKLLPPGFDAKKFGGETPYSIMFGPDVCGTSTRKTHVIFTYGGKNLLTKKNVRCETDRLSHRYTLVVHPDNTYEVQIDGKKAESGSLYDDWDFLAPRKIKDPNASKPSNWVDEAEIPDPSDVKPAGYDDAPAKIPDPSAKVRLRCLVCLPRGSSTPRHAPPSSAVGCWALVCTHTAALAACRWARPIVPALTQTCSFYVAPCRSLRTGMTRRMASGRPP